MRGSLGQPIIIENVSGADGSNGTDRVARARPDGYAIELGGTSTHMMNGAVYSLPFDIVNDFAPVSRLVTSHYVLLARKTMPAKDLNELIAWLPTIRGNHDRWVTDWLPEEHYRWDALAFQELDAAQLAWLRALPPTLDLGNGIFACHGRPHDDNAYLLENVEAGRLVPARYAQVVERVRAVGSRFVLCGHSHIPGAAAADHTMVINPGSVGLPAYEDPTPPAHVSESGSPLARY